MNALARHVLTSREWLALALDAANDRFGPGALFALCIALMWIAAALLAAVLP